MNTTAEDGFRIFYTEKIWELIPGIYRHEDGLADNPNPGVLRAIVEILAEQAVILRRSQDRLWEDQFIENCNEWAVPYIGDLLGTRLLSAINTRGRRIDVAKTIYYRRHKGTPQVLQELISDISSWDGKLVEGFQRLVRARHGLDPHPGLDAGRYTHTMPGGIADLRNPAASELSDGPFEEYFHIPDIRKPKGLDGRYGISKLNFYLYRLFAYPVINAESFKVADNQYMFDPSGRTIPLFSKSNRPKINGWENWHTPFEWELPYSIRCHLLAHAEYVIKEEHIQSLLSLGMLSAQGAKLLSLVGFKFRNESELKKFTGFLNPAFFPDLLRLSIVQNCGKYQLYPGSINVTAAPPLGTIPQELMNATNLTGFASTVSDKELLIDAEEGKFKLNLPAAGVAGGVTATYYYGFSGSTGAGTYPRPLVEDSQPTLPVPTGGGNIGAGFMVGTAVVQVDDNFTYHITSNNSSVKDYTLQVADECRPYFVLSNDWILDTAPAADATLVLNGIWLGSPGDKQFDVIVKGDFECIVIRNCTFDPGGSQNALSENILPVSLIIEGTVENLCIESSIMGPVIIKSNGLIEEKIWIADSIIQSVNPALPALIVESGLTELLRSTVLGDMIVHRLYASDSLITGMASVLDTQEGCFRFSGANKASLLPRPYESYLFDQAGNHWFGSKKFGHPAYAQLSDTIPTQIWTGAENGAEMGAFNKLINAIKREGLQTKVEEYMPFGLIPAFINQNINVKP